jgi:ABC-type multidrug transport system fused ATPase/permease subunit
MKVSNRVYLELLTRYLKPQWRLALALGFLLVVFTTLPFVSPLLLGSFIDTAIGGGAEQTLFWLALGFLGLAFLTQVVSVFEVYVAENLGWLATNRLRSDVAGHCLNLDMGYLNRYTPGELIERIDGDVAALGNFFSRFVIYMLGNLLLLLAVLGLLVYIDWRLGLVLSLVTFVGMLVIIRIRNLAAPMWQASRQAKADMFGFIEERLNGTEDVRSAGAINYTMSQLHRHQGRTLINDRRAGLITTLITNNTRFFFAIGTSAGFGMIVFLFQGGAISLGTAFLIYRYTEMLSRPIEEINKQMQDFQQATASIVRVKDLLSTPISITPNAGSAVRLPAQPPVVEFTGVSFEYAEDEPVLQDISFRLPEGQVLGLLGRSGSGKTTLSRLLFRLYDPTAGEIRLNQVAISDLPLAELRRHIGLVTQDIQLFHASVRDNLTFFDPEIPDAQIIKVITELGLDSWFNRLENGLETRLAPTGHSLSGGEAQLLSFARVFLKNPQLVILDEATSRLDPVTEHRVELAVNRLLKGRTAIIIAHRLATVQRVDQIMILEKGRILEVGRREALANDPHSEFAQLLRVGLEDTLA